MIKRCTIITQSNTRSLSTVSRGWIVLQIFAGRRRLDAGSGRCARVVLERRGGAVPPARAGDGAAGLPGGAEKKRGGR